VFEETTSQGTVIKRNGTTTSQSKYSETSMVRVVEEDFEDENNYLMNLEQETNDR
jgi:hypothetical protein